MELLLLTAARALGIYAAALIVVRLSGKRTIGNFSAFDLLVALMLGEIVDEVVYGDVGLAEGAVVMGTIALAQYGNSWLCYWGHGFDQFLEGQSTVIVRRGRLESRGMRAERMNERDVMSELRLNGIEDVREVKLATVETNGEVSVLLEEWAEPLQKADLGVAMASQRRQEKQGRPSRSADGQSARPAGRPG